MMTLKQLTEALVAAKSAGATDTTPIYVVSDKMEYMRNIKAIHFQMRESWPVKDWPVVIFIEQK